MIRSMFFQLLFVHLYRPFLKYSRGNSSLLPHVSPRKICTQSATVISKLLRMYKKTHGLKQICNIVVYIAHSACTIHLLNLPDKNSIRDIIHGVRHLEEIGESWLCARKTLAILSVVARRWKTALPVEVANVFSHNDSKFSLYRQDLGSPKHENPLPILDQATPQGSMPSHLDQSTDHFLPDQSTSDCFAANSSSVKEESPSIGDVTSWSYPIVDPDQNPQEEQYVALQDRQDLWNRDHVLQISQIQGQPSPSLPFGGIDSLVAESQGWWFRDNSFFENWYGPDQAALMVNNGIPPDLDFTSSNLGSYELDANGLDSDRATF